jgi:hypothetical protein
MVALSNCTCLHAHQSVGAAVVATGGATVADCLRTCYMVTRLHAGGVHLSPPPCTTVHGAASAAAAAALCHICFHLRLRGAWPPIMPHLHDPLPRRAPSIPPAAARHMSSGRHLRASGVLLLICCRLCCIPCACVNLVPAYTQLLPCRPLELSSFLKRVPTCNSVSCLQCVLDCP